MRLFRYMVLSVLFLTSGRSEAQTFVTSDIDNFWLAYDNIIKTKDSAEQYRYLREYYLDRASPGLKTFMWARGLSTQLYLEVINKYPEFWKSVRQNTLRSKKYIPDVREMFEKFREWYPETKPVEIYYLVGCLNSGGTALEGKFLVGTELAMGDENTISSELSSDRGRNLRQYFDENSREDFALLNLQGYIQSQQKGYGHDLLIMSLQMGVSEFVSSVVSGLPSSKPAITQGKNNLEKIFRKFEQDMFSLYKDSYWLHSDTENEFGLRDLGFFIGYIICEKYFDQAADKKLAIKELIELNFSDQTAVEKVVDGTKLFSEPLADLLKDFENTRPMVTGVKQFKNGTHNVDPGITEITVMFSTKMDTRYKSTGMGDLGGDHFPRVYAIDFAEDGLSITYKVRVDANKEYQFLLEQGFRSTDLVQLKPYMVTFKTAKE